jgi:hypothetical protein
MSRFHLIDWSLACRLCILNKAPAMSVRARVVRYRVTPTAGRRRLIGSLVRFPRPLLLLGLCVESGCPFFSAVFLFRVCLVPLACPILSAPLLSRLSSWRFFCSWSFFYSWLFFYSCSIFLHVSCVSPVYVALDF